MNADSMLGYLLFGDFGVLTTTPAYLLGLLFPVVALFHFFMNCLEQSGLFAKWAVRLDKLLAFFGLSGHSLVPLFMGFGCVTVALASLSDLKSKRERFIASSLLCILVPCSAQTAVIIVLATLIEYKYFLFYLFMILFAATLLSLSLHVFIPKERHASPFHNKALKRPEYKKIFKNAVLSGMSFVKETAVPFIIGSVIVSLLNWLHFFAALSDILSPFTTSFLKLPKEAASLFILSVIKRDLGAAGLLSVIQSGAFTDAQLAVCLTVMTLFVPCFASVILLVKQEKLANAVFIWAGSFIIALTVGKLASLLLL